MVQETADYREKNNVKRNDFLQLLIQLKNKGFLDDEQKSEDQNDGRNKNNETSEGTYTFDSKMYKISILIVQVNLPLRY